MIVTAFVTSCAILRRKGTGSTALVIAAATGLQLLLVLSDPAPFQYVYGWALIPTLAGLAPIGEASGHGHADKRLAYFGLCLAGFLASLSAAYAIVKQQQPPTGSILRLSVDRPMDQGELARISTPKLVSRMISGEGQQLLWNQLSVRSALCRRVNGPVLSVLASHPICLSDTSPDWIDFGWPAMHQGTVLDERRFAAMIGARPELFIWGRQSGAARLHEGAIARLRSCYRSYPGFALLTEQCRKASASSAKGGCCAR
jgi:hypothetical protein